jgi:hypothetical protein
MVLRCRPGSARDGGAGRTNNPQASYTELLGTSHVFKASARVSRSGFPPPPWRIFLQRTQKVIEPTKSTVVSQR